MGYMGHIGQKRETTLNMYKTLLLTRVSQCSLIEEVQIDVMMHFLPLKTWCICAALFLTLFISLKLGTALGIESSPAAIAREINMSHPKSILIHFLHSECADKLENRDTTTQGKCKVSIFIYLARCTSCDTWER